MGSTSVNFAGCWASVKDYEEDCLWKRDWKEGDEGYEEDAPYIPNMDGVCCVKIGSRRHPEPVEVNISAEEAHKYISVSKEVKSHWLFRWMIDRLLAKRVVFVAYVTSSFRGGGEMKAFHYFLQSPLGDPNVVLGLKPVGHVFKSKEDINWLDSVGITQTDDYEYTCKNI